MALHFVATSVLTSTDGIDFSKEEALDTEESRRSRREAEEATRKPLFMQLQELRDKKQEEYDSNTKKLFAAPKALDEDDISFLNDVEDHRVQAMDQRAATEKEALAAFRAARSQMVISSSAVAMDGNSTYIDPTKVPSAPSSSSSYAPHILIPPKKEQDTSTFTQPIITSKKRRKVEDGMENNASDTKRVSTGGSGSEERNVVVGKGMEDKKEDVAKSSTEKTGTLDGSSSGTTGGSGAGAALSLLGGYGSDEED